MKITHELLAQANACFEQQERFAELFPADQYPDGVTVTVELAQQHAAVFGWDWAAGEWLDADRCEAYRKIRDTAEDAMDEALLPLLAAFDDARRAFLNAYGPAPAVWQHGWYTKRSMAMEKENDNPATPIGSAYAAYNKAHAEQQAIRGAAIAAAFAEQFIAQYGSQEAAA